MNDGGKDATKEAIRVNIRWLIRRDMPEVLRIDQASFDQTWSEQDFLLCLRQRNCIGMVAEQAERVAGFMIYELHKTRLHILNFAVHPGFRRRSVGTQMSSKLINKLAGHRRTAVDVDLRETNLVAQQFFRKQGFKATQVLRAFYPDSGEDAFVMEYRLAADRSQPKPQRVNRLAQYEN
jgi:ribosomal-protein-alanine N-acetyltransferase